MLAVPIFIGVYVFVDAMRLQRRGTPVAPLPPVGWGLASAVVPFVAIAFALKARNVRRDAPARGRISVFNDDLWDDGPKATEHSAPEVP